MNVGIKDIAKACGLSNNSVSDILNRGRQHLYRPDTRDRVLRAAEAMNYRPNRSAQSMRNQRTRVVGFLASNMNADSMLENYAVYPFLIGMSHYFTQRRYHVSLVEMEEFSALSDGGQQGLPEVLRERFLDGLVAHYGVPNRAYELLNECEAPVIWWDTGGVSPYDNIYRDEMSASGRLIRHLVELGHERIAIMVGETGWQKYTDGLSVHYSYKQRYETFVAEMEALNLIPLRIHGYGSDEIAEQLIRQKTTAILIGSQQISMLFAPCARLGWSIPEQLSIAVYDRETRIRVPALDVCGMSYDRYEAGQRASEMLLAKIETPEKGVPTQIIKPKFVAGSSTAAPRIG